MPAKSLWPYLPDLGSRPRLLAVAGDKRRDPIPTTVLRREATTLWIPCAGCRPRLGMRARADSEAVWQWPDTQGDLNHGCLSPSPTRATLSPALVIAGRGTNVASRIRRGRPAIHPIVTLIHAVTAPKDPGLAEHPGQQEILITTWTDMRLMAPSPGSEKAA